MFLAIGSFLSSFWSIVVAFIALLIMVTVHEFGHYSAGKLLGFKINEFAIGFGPKIFSRKKKDGEVFSIRILPLGGFCAFEGEDEESDNKNAFNNQKPWKRIIVTVAGVAFNFLSAILILTCIFTFVGDAYPKVVTTESFQNKNIVHTLQKDDIILEIDGHKAYGFFTNFREFYQKSEGTVNMTVLRNNKKVDLKVPVEKITVTPEKGDSYQENRINISITGEYIRENIFKAFWHGITMTWDVIVLIISTIGKIFTGLLSVKNNLGGPITTIKTVASSIHSGLGFFLILAVMSASIGFTNILPLPALDGSRVVFITLEKLRGKPINRKVEGMIHFVGIIVLFSLTILLDIINLI